MTHQQFKRWLSLFAALVLGPLAPCAAAETGQWVAKGTQPKPPADKAAAPGETPANGQQPVIIYVPQGTPLPPNQPSWVLEGFLKAKENAAKEADATAKSLTPLDSPKPDNGATVRPQPKAFQPPAIEPRIASPVPTPTLAPPIVEGKPEGGGLFRWPDGMISEYSGDVAPPAKQPVQRPKALFAPKTAQPAPPPVPQTPQPNQGLVDRPRSSLMPTNRPPTRSAVVKTTPAAPPAAPAEMPPTAPLVPPVAPQAEPQSVVVQPQQPQSAPAEPSDAKALFPRSVISKYLPSDKSSPAGSTANGQPSSRGNKSWSRFLPSNPPSAGKTAFRPAAPALPEVVAPTPEPVLTPPADRGLAENEPAPGPAKSTPRPSATRSRGKALFSRSRPEAAPAPVASGTPAAPPKPPVAVAGPVDPFSANAKLMPQTPRQARSDNGQPIAAGESKTYAEPVPPQRREVLAHTVPTPLGQPSITELPGSKRRVQITPPAPQTASQLARSDGSFETSPEKRFAEQKVSPRPWKSALDVDEPSAGEEPHADSPRPASVAKVAQQPRPTPGTEAAVKPPSRKPVVEVVTVEPAPRAELARKPTIVEPEPADRIQAVVSDESSTAATSQAPQVDVSKAAVAPSRPNPIRMREQADAVDSVLTSAVSPEPEVDRKQDEDLAGAVRPNPIRVTRGASRGGNNPLR